MTKTIFPLLGIAAILSIFAALIFYMQSSPRFEINRVGVRGTSQLMPTAIVEYLRIPPHSNIFQIQLDGLQRKLERLQWVKHAEVFRNFPNKLSIKLAERIPFALVKVDELYLVDIEGVVLGALASGSAIHLPIISGAFVERIRLDGENPKFAQMFSAIHALLTSPHQIFQHVRKVRIDSPENVTFFTERPFPHVRLSLLAYESGVKRIEHIFSARPVEQIAWLDLRFEKRIIVTPNKS